MSFTEGLRAYIYIYMMGMHAAEHAEDVSSRLSDEDEEEELEEEDNDDDDDDDDGDDDDEDEDGGGGVSMAAATMEGLTQYCHASPPSPR
jgi:hypothetical protein